jgi:hypothetical protein
MNSDLGERYGVLRRRAVACLGEAVVALQEVVHLMRNFIYPEVRRTVRLVDQAEVCPPTCDTDVGEIMEDGSEVRNDIIFV